MKRIAFGLVLLLAGCDALPPPEQDLETAEDEVSSAGGGSSCGSITVTDHEGSFTYNVECSGTAEPSPFEYDGGGNTGAEGGGGVEGDYQDTALFGAKKRIKHKVCLTACRGGQAACEHFCRKLKSKELRGKCWEACATGGNYWDGFCDNYWGP